MAGRGQVDADLVRAAGRDRDRDHGPTFVNSQYAHVRDGATRPIGTSIVKDSTAGTPLTGARYSFSTRPARHSAATARRALSVLAKRTGPDVPRPSRCIGAE
jgi:hypothetical protein